MKPSPDLLQTLLTGEFKITRRPVPVAGDLRINWGLAIIIMILGRSRQNKASYQKIHLLAHAVRTPETQRHTLMLLQQERSRLLPLVRVEPWVNRAVNLAAALELVCLEAGSSIRLLDAGMETFKKLTENGGVLKEEWEFLSSASILANEKKVSSIMNMDYLAWG